jgi:hypothetical protein
MNDARMRQGSGWPAWPIALVFGVFIVWHVSAAWYLHDVARRQAETIGQVTSFVRGNHASLPYAYAVGGVRYEGRYYPGAETIKLRPSVTVYYDREYPAVSGLIDFDDRAMTAAGPAIFISFLGGVIGLFFAIHRVLRRPPK